MLSVNDIYNVIEAGLRPLVPLLATLAVVTAACEESVQAPTADDDLAHLDAGSIAYGLETYTTVGGIRDGEVRADTAYQFADSAVSLLWGVDMRLFHPDGTDRARVIADRGRLSQRTDEMTAWGNVVLTILEGNRRIESAELHYDPDADRIWSDSATVHVYQGRETRGSCFESDLDFENLQVCDIRGAADLGTQPDTAGAGGREPADTVDAGGERRDGAEEAGDVDIGEPADTGDAGGSGGTGAEESDLVGGPPVAREWDAGTP